MTTQANLSVAHAVFTQIDNATQALALLAMTGVQITIEVAAPGNAGVRVPLTISPGVITGPLNTQLASLRNQLTALGVTG